MLVGEGDMRVGRVRVHLHKVQFATVLLPTKHHTQHLLTNIQHPAVEFALEVCHSDMLRVG